MSCCPANVTIPMIKRSGVARFWVSNDGNSYDREFAASIIKQYHERYPTANVSSFDMGRHDWVRIAITFDNEADEAEFILKESK